MNFDIQSSPNLCDHDPSISLAVQAKQASRSLRLKGAQQRTQALRIIASVLADHTNAILAANQTDLRAATEQGLSSALLDRLKVDEKRLTAIIDAVTAISRQPDPVGEIIQGRILDSGIRLQQKRVPLGVLFVIFESRPNVAVDAAALALRSGNAIILRGGKEALHTNAALVTAIQAGLNAANFPSNTVQRVATTDRSVVHTLLQQDDLIDLCIPRGGPDLIQAVLASATMPILKHLAGLCHLYLDEHCQHDRAVAIVSNAKTQRPGVCNAIETLLVHQSHIKTGLLQKVIDALKSEDVVLLGDSATCALDATILPATSADWETEYLDKKLSIRVVDSIDQAIAHIDCYGSRHTDAIVTDHLENADKFTTQVDSANVFVNCSTRFADGSCYGLGAEIGISTDKLHARGPVGARDLTTTQWVAYGTGQIRS